MDFIINYEKMKKIMFVVLVLFGLALFVGCSSCGGDKPVAPKGELVLEDVVSADREYMALNYSKDYVWFESQVILNDYLDSDSCDGSFSDILNVFQYVKQVGKFEKPYVVMFSHSEGVDSVSVIQSSWLEDVVLEDSLIKLSFKEAFDIAMKSDLQKPHSIHACLRNPLGPKLVNPQYVFGNIHKQIWIDAKTGEASDTNPAFK